ncbi:MAG: T9SS type A sorting domain-containing protein [Bacteroidetes bacterium]|nr:T9SS type A sorting domain-containing protein [Bacteroidota bacterium]
MKIRLLLFSAAVALGIQANAQTWVADSVTMGAGYANDVFYSMTNGASGSPVSNTNWHLGFEMIPGGPGFGGVSIIANHVQAGVKVYSLHTTGSAKFATLSASDTVGKTQLYNADSSWDWGAFNVNSSGGFNYGWGDYDMVSHHIYGDSLYLLNVGGTLYKMVVTHNHTHPLDSIYYAFHIGKFDNSTNYFDTIWRKPNYVNKNFAYFDVAANSEINREPDQKTWDVAFTRYMDYKAGPPGGIPYNTTGVLSNVGVTVADVRPVNPDTTVSYKAYNYTKTMNEIGFDWKIFTPPTGPYTIDTTITYFIKTKDTAVYQIKFTGFTSSTGKIVFAKRLWQFPANVNEVTNNISAHMIVPNPANNNADLVIDAKEASGNTMLIVTDITGKVALKSNVALNKGLNALQINTGDLATGTYMITVTNGAWKITDKLAVQH